MITLIYIWEIERKNIFPAVWRMATHRRALKKVPTISFFKLLGTGTGHTFTPRDANPLVWALLVTLNEDSTAENTIDENTIDENTIERFDRENVLQSWRKISVREARLTAIPLSTHGLWSKRQPFALPSNPTESSHAWDEKVLAITRARISWLKNLAFWRAVPPVIDSLRESDGLELAIGIGEAPIGLQGTLSIWRDSKSVRAFAYKSSEHRSVIERTQSERWYSEELFARFALIEVRGELPSH